ncbi:putative clathrin assembly protein [Raphanus sativus]|uniref:Clathrin assembly protein At1g14910 n=1 Tax=Raphanus sativus TaxID=3726 RepID=A0A6J0P378_RAPSA|nr:putative clathrin assembly protein At1g14910 [Raphanus sativus]KAJ4915817.1 putative clathrin assembly protein [Raphanus sativus]
MGTLQSFRRAYGALKDTTKVGLVRVNSDYADIEVAIVKATNHVECPPKDRHLRKIFIATSATRPRADVAYCIHTLSRRLHKTRNWTVALKALLVLHRLVREGDPTFREELLNFSRKGRFLQLSNFKDDSSTAAWDCSVWVRAYALFLEERLQCFRVLKYDIEAERLPKVSPGQEKGYSKTRDLDGEELLEQLPALQQLLHRLMGCKPEGAAKQNHIIQYALALVLKESFKVYCAINEGIINLVEKFFEMPRHDAVKSLDIYKRAGLQAGNLSQFYEVCKGLELARNFQFPVLREPPQSFLATMEEYMRDAPQMVDVSDGPLLLTYRPDEELSGEPSHEEHEPSLPSDSNVVPSEETQPPASAETPQNLIDTDDLLGLNRDAPDPLEILDQNALALALVSTDVESSIFDFSQARDSDPSGWELALVTTPSSDISAATERQLAGGLDTLTLNSLYDDVTHRAAQQPAFGAPAPNPFEVQDPFAFSNSISPSPSESNPFGPYQPAYQQQQQQELQVAPGAANPFGDFEEFAIVAVTEPPKTTGFVQFPVVSEPQMTTGFGGNPVFALSEPQMTTGFGDFSVAAVSEPQMTTGFGEFPVVNVSQPQVTNGLGELPVAAVSEPQITTGFGEFPVFTVSEPQMTTGFTEFPVATVSEPQMMTSGFGEFPAFAVSEPQKTSGFGDSPVAAVSEPQMMTSGFGKFPAFAVSEPQKTSGPVVPVSEEQKNSGFGEFSVITASEPQKTTGFGGYPANSASGHQQFDSSNPFGGM